MMQHTLYLSHVLGNMPGESGERPQLLLRRQRNCMVFKLRKGTFMADLPSPLQIPRAN